MPPGDPRRYARDHTTHFETADAEGNLVAVTQSNGAAFGNGFVAGDTGITLQNRGAGFTLQAGHPNQVGPHKRPLHTLVPEIGRAHV